MGVAAAYAMRKETGRGQRVDTSLFEAGIVHTYWQSAICFATGSAPGPLGSAHPLNAPYQAFETADGWINIGAANQRNWERLIALIDAAELQDDPRFSTNAARIENLPALVNRLNTVFRRRTTAKWLDVLDAGGLPAGPVLSVKEMHDDPQTIARQMVTTVDHPRAGRVATIGLPVKFSETPGAVCAPAPLLGQHTRSVLAEAGYDEGSIDALIASGAAFAEDEP